MITTAINILYLSLLASWATKKPTRFVIGYIIYSSSYLGFLSPHILFSNIEFGALLSNIIPLLAAFAHKNKLKDTPTRYIIITILSFYIYGLLKPVINGHNHMIMSIVASKSFTYYFFVIYVLVLRECIDFNKVFKWIFYISIYYSTLYILNGLHISIRPPLFIKGDGIQCYFDSYLVLSLLYLYSPKCYIGKRTIYTIILFLGIYFGDFFSLLATSIISLPILYLITKYYKNKQKIIFVSVGLILLFSLSFCVFTQTQLYEQIIEKQTNSLISRGLHNEFRWQLINQKFYWGYGFIHKDSHFLSFYNNDSSEYMTSLSFIDSGYTDLMGRFGLLGTILFLLIPLFVIKNRSKDIDNIFCVVFIVQLFAINITWSVFTFQMGIILLAITYSYLLKNKIVLK